MKWFVTVTDLYLKKYIAEAVKKYSAWSAPKVTEKKTVAIFYASAYGYTKKMADTIEKRLNLVILMLKNMTLPKSTMK